MHVAICRERKGWQVEAQILGLSRVEPEGQTMECCIAWAGDAEVHPATRYHVNAF